MVQRASGARRAPLGINDVFEVRVYGEQDLTGNYRVSAAGTIDFPYIGRIQVLGMEPPEIAERIRESLQSQGVLVRPQVSVMVTSVTSRRISVFGQVRTPGTQDYVQGMDVVMAISSAGGFTQLANRSSVRITRRQADGTSRTISLSIDEITEGRAGNFELEPGDIVFVPEVIV